jgi:hypothetical protein
MMLTAEVAAAVITILALAKILRLDLVFLSRASSPASASVDVAARYRPMKRLLDTADFNFLASHPASNPKMIKNMRAERVQLFRAYLRSLTLDFARTATGLESVMVSSNVDRPDLAKLVHSSRLSFATGLVSVECRLVLFRYGMGTVDVQPLVAAIASMREQLRAGVMLPAAA